MSYITKKNKKENAMAMMYDGYSDEEIQEMLEMNISKYCIVRKSEKIALSLIQNKGGQFFYLHSDFYQKFQSLLIYAKSRKIAFHQDSDYEVTCEDVIERIREIEAKKIENIYEFYRVFASSNANSNEMSNVRQKLESDIQKTNEFYDEIANSYKEKCARIAYYKR